MKRLNVGEREMLRRIYGLVVEQGMWRIATDQEMRGPYIDLDVIVNIKKRLKWIGYLKRMDNERVIRKIFESKLEGRMKMGGPRMRWLEDTGKIYRR
jgi:hypothetical protein